MSDRTTARTIDAFRPARLRALALGVSMLALGATPALAELKLNILHINDPHSRIEPINRFNSTCSAEDRAEDKCFGGFARLKTAIEQRKDALDGATIVVSAGDHFQGSLFYTTYKGAIEAEMANALGIEVFTVGNHEFDDGQEELGAFLDATNFQVLGGNVDANDDSGVEGRIDRYVIADIDGEQVGFVGVVASDTAETSSPGPNITIGDDMAALKEAVAELAERGVNKIVAVTHVGLARDREIAEQVPEIDLIIGGHSHTLLANTHEDAEGPYPTVVNDTPIVQAGAYTKYLGELTVTFDDAGEVVSAEGEPILLDASIEEDAGLAERIASLADPIEELKATVVGEATEAIDGDRANCRARECQMGNLVTDAMLERVRDQGVEIAIQNGGGLRASIDAGEITMGEVLTVLPFQNTLATFRLKGADILASLENGVSEIEEGGGRFPQVAGMSYAFDASKPAGERISDVMVGGEPLDPERMYGVVSNDFMRRGGDGYSAFADNAEDAYDYGPGLEQVLADYIGAQGAVTPTIDNRITDLAAASAEPAAGDEAPAEESGAAEGTAETADGSAEAGAAEGAAAEAINEMVPDAPAALEEAPQIAETDGDAAGAATAAADGSAEAESEGDGEIAAGEPSADEASDAGEASMAAGDDEQVDEEEGAASMTAEDGNATDEADEENTDPTEEDGTKMAAGSGDASAEAMESLEEERDEAAEAINEAVPDAPDALAEAPMVEGEAQSADASDAATDSAQGDAVEGSDGTVDGSAGEAVEAINESVEDAPEALEGAPEVASEDSDADATENGGADATDAVAATDESAEEADVEASGGESMADGATAASTAETGTATADEADAEAIAGVTDAEPTDGEAIEAINESVEDAPEALEGAPEVAAEDADAEASEPSDGAATDTAEATEQPASDPDAAEQAAAEEAATQDADAQEAERADAQEPEAQEPEAQDGASDEAVAEINQSVEDAPDALEGAPEVAEDVEAEPSADGSTEMAEQEPAEAEGADQTGTDQAADTDSGSETEQMADKDTMEQVETDAGGDAMADGSTGEDMADAEEADASAEPTDSATADGDAMAESGDAMADGEATSDGAAMTDTDAMADATPDGAAGKEYVIMAGDSYWRIAEREYGDGNLYTLLEEANDTPANRLKVGQTIVIPPRP